MIYLDHAATTPVISEARAAIAEALEHGWGNPSSGHAAGRRARARLETAREQVAVAANAAPEQVIFTSGATESINWVVAATGPGRVLVSAVEHPAVGAALALRSGREVEVLPVGEDGRVDPADVLARADAGPRPALVAVMAANNETGILQPVAELCQPLRERGIPLMVDAVQYVGRFAIDFQPDFLIVTAHKLGGPKGVGGLVLRPGSAPAPLVDGGGQERGLRGGTEPVPAAVGFGAAMAMVAERREAESERLGALRDRLQELLLERLPGSRVVGRRSPKLPSTLCFALPEGAQAHVVTERLDRAGICVSAGSACHAGSTTPSRVLTAMGLEPAVCTRVLRFSLGWGSHEGELAPVVAEVARAVAG